VGLDFLLGLLAEQGWAVKSIPVGSTAGLAALARGEGDVAGIHLLDEATGEYNRPFLPPGVGLERGYGRRQGVAFRRGDPDFDVPDLDSFLAAVRRGGRRMVNRNPGSGTRVLLDRLLGGARPDGYANQPRTHHAVAAAIAQGRADWGMTLDAIAAAAGLGFLFVQDERYDLAVPDARRSRPAVAALLALLQDEDVRGRLRGLGFTA
jgi:putative molybdopterin biosynthesis protein